jgi:UPF0716 protein FxsA
MPPLLLLMILFTAIPLVELWLLFQMGNWIGFWTTIGLVLGTGFAGAALARWQGWQVMERVQGEMRQGMLPANAMGDGALILVAGVLLITPGVLTDLVGLSLLIPPIRTLLKKVVTWWWTHHVHAETVTYWQAQNGADTTQHPQGIPHDNIIDAHVVSSEVVEEP